jgi:hypothetical protein
VDRRELLKVAIVIVVGGALVLNPVYLFPDGGGEVKVTYSVSEIPADSPPEQALGIDERILQCPSQRTCALEEPLATNGSIQYEGPVYQRAPYSVVNIEGELYQPRNESGTGTTTLSLEPITAMEAVEILAIPADELGPNVQTAVETGSVTVYDEAANIPAFDRGWVIEHDGRYYWQDRVTGTTTYWERPSVVLLFRVVLWSLGIALLLYAGRAYDRANRKTTGE